MIKTKTIISGEMLECEVYPVWERDAKREKRHKITTLAQQKVNHRNTVKRVIRLINTNFTKRDIWMTLTYKTKPTEEQAKRDIQNFIRRLKRRKGNLKYIYVTETGEKRIHHHIILNIEDRDMAEGLWTLGRTNARRLQPDDYGLEGLARYITKEKNTADKRYTCSRNLDKPIVYEDKTMFTRRDTDKIVRNENKARERFERMYLGYVFRDLIISESVFISGWYIYVRLQKL